MSVPSWGSGREPKEPNEDGRGCDQSSCCFSPYERCPREVLGEEADERAAGRSITARGSGREDALRRLHTHLVSPSHALAAPFTLEQPPTAATINIDNSARRRARVIRVRHEGDLCLCASPLESSPACRLGVW